MARFQLTKGLSHAKDRALKRCHGREERGQGGRELCPKYLCFVSWSPSPKLLSFAQEKSRLLTKLAWTFLGLLQVLQEESDPIKEA